MIDSLMDNWSRTAQYVIVRGLCILLVLLGVLVVTGQTIVYGATRYAPPPDSGNPFIPFLDVVPSEDGTELYIRANSAEQQDDVTLRLRSRANEDDGDTSHKDSWTMVYSDTLQAYVSVLGGIDPKVGYTDGLNVSTPSGFDNEFISLHRAYLPAASAQTIHSSDRALTLAIVNDNTVPVDTYIAVVQSYGPPDLLPPEHKLASNIYSIRASGALVQTESPMNVRLNYNSELLGEVDPQTLAIFAWDAGNRSWRNLGGRLFTSHKYVSVSTNLFTTYVLMSVPESGNQLDSTQEPSKSVVPLFPIIEEFDSPDGFQFSNPERFSFIDGNMEWEMGGEGAHFAYYPIPSFRGDVQITVQGQVDEWENNCGAVAGVGDALHDSNGMLISYGFFGGGCQTQGALIGAQGVQLNREILAGCEYEGMWTWIEPKRPYTSVLTVSGPTAELGIPTVGNVTGTVKYTGTYPLLFIGNNGFLNAATCRGSIDRIMIEPLENAFFAPSDLLAVATYPTQIDLTWTDNSEQEAAFLIERSLDQEDWVEIGQIEPESTTFQDSRVTCDTTYYYRVGAHRAHDIASVYSFVADVTTSPCLTVFVEEWESEIQMARWAIYGDPLPILVRSEGYAGSTALNPNGDGTFHSGLISHQAFDITSGINVTYRLKGKGIIGERWSGAKLDLTSCLPSVNLNECDGYSVGVSAIYESDGFVFESGSSTQRVEWAPFDDEKWHEYRFHIRPDGFVDFFRDDVLLHRSTTPLDFNNYSLMHLRASASTVNATWRFDDFRVTVPNVPDWYIKVVDEFGQPVGEAKVYADGELIGVTNQAGMVHSDLLPEGTALVAVAGQATVESAREFHPNGAYTVNLTSFDWDAEGRPAPFIVQEPSEQRLVLKRARPLILFNLVVSIEWEASQEYLDEIQRSLRLSSDYLFDLTDGQMAFGEVVVYHKRDHWGAADIQIAAKNIVRPHAYVGGITDSDPSHTIRIGRYWDGASGDVGTWDQHEGYRTIVHEFGHYGLHLYDEYFGYLMDDEGNLLDELPAYCTGPDNRNPETDATNASAMDHQYSASELSARAVEGLWDPRCEETAQAQQNNGESAWETIVRVFADTQESPRWHLITPMETGQVNPGPTSIPEALPALPRFTVHAVPAESTRHLTVLDPQGIPQPGAIVALYKQKGNRVIGQGFTDGDGRIDIFGAANEDTVRAATIDGRLEGSLWLNTEEDPKLHLALVGVNPGEISTRHQGTLNTHPHVQIRAEPSPNPDQIDLLIFVHDVGLGADPAFLISGPGRRIGDTPVLSYSPAINGYQGQFTISRTDRGTGDIRGFTPYRNGLRRIHATYRLQRVFNSQPQDIFSDDGNLSLHLAAGSLPANEAYFVVNPPGFAPGPIPDGQQLIGDVYDITASGALVTLEKSAILNIRFDELLVGSKIAPADLSLYRWGRAERMWQEVPSSLDEEHRTLVAQVQALGTFAVMIEREDRELALLVE